MRDALFSSDLTDEGDLCPFCGEVVFTLTDVDLDGREFGGVFCCEASRDNFDRDNISPAAWRALFRDQAGIEIKTVVDGDDQLGDEYLLDYGLTFGEVSQREAFDFINKHHSHNIAPRGWLFGFGLYNGRELVGVAAVGRPNARKIDALFYAPQVLAAFYACLSLGCLFDLRGVRLGFDVPTVTAEVTRVCVKRLRSKRLTGFACSKLYAAAEREIEAQGYLRAITYILETEKGTALAARGWVDEHRTRAERWNRQSRPRRDVAPAGRKIRYALYF